MDTLRLLSRGTKGKCVRSNKSTKIVPSAEAAQPQLFGGEPPAKKRRVSEADDEEQHATSNSLAVSAPDIGSIKSTLKQHKIKVAWLKPPPPPKKSKRSQTLQPAKLERPHVFPVPIQNLSEASLVRLGIPQQLAANIRTQGYSAATEVQMAALPLILDLVNASTPQGTPDLPSGCPNLLTVAPTGSGKTLAFLIPTISRIMAARAGTDIVEGGTAALILAPTKELVGQIVNEGKILLQGVDLKISAYRKDMVLDAETTRTPDILVSTPGSLATTLQLSAPLLTVQYLVLDEADVLLDPLFREQTISIWNNLHNPQLRTSLWSATMGSNIEDLAFELIRSQQQVSGATDEVPLIRLVVGLKDSAVPNVEHRLVYAANEQGKLMGLRSLLHPATAAEESLRPPLMVFTQTIERAVALHHEMLYDIPTEAGGVSRIAVLHANLSDNARSDVMARFRKGEIWILITTDLLSRGIDFRGVNGVVNYDIPTSSAAYVHRAGRTGRAGRQGGVAVTLYTKDDIPYLKQIANVIAAAQKQGKLEGNASVQQWLLDALPTLNQNERKRFKKHGVESRTARGMENDPKAARRARISTQAGYIRKIENNRKASIAASRRRAAEAGASDDSDDGFTGFD